MTANNHIVKKITLNLGLENQMNPGIVRSEVISAVKSKLRSRLSDFMDEICDETEVLRIDRLEIDLGNTSLEELPNEVMKQISEQLTVTNIKSLRNFPDVKPKQSTGERKLDALVDYLKKGTLSWWSPLKDSETINAYFQELVEEKTEVNKRLNNAFKKAIITHNVALRRLVFQMPAPTVQKLIEKWYPNRIAETKDFIHKVSPILEKIFVLNSQPFEKVQLIVQLIAAEKRKAVGLSKTEFLSIFMAQLKWVYGENVLRTSYVPAKDKPLAKNEELIRYLTRKRITQPAILLEELASVLVGGLGLPESIQLKGNKQSLTKKKSNKNTLQNNNGKGEEREGGELEGTAPELKEGEGVINKGVESEPETNPEKAAIFLKESVAEEESLKLDSATFQYAGIVIIWPMISPLFEDRGLLENKTFKDEAAQLKGLSFLNYLACGDEQMEEFDMPLNKVLCGLPVSYPVTTLIELTDDDKRECGVLLQHLIDNWPILKTTSINGLREGFIMREGELEEEDENWLLKVEKRSIDLLMDRMPWGFRTIKLPWMSKILIVEW